MVQWIQTNTDQGHFHAGGFPLRSRAHFLRWAPEPEIKILPASKLKIEDPAAQIFKHLPTPFED